MRIRINTHGLNAHKRLVAEEETVELPDTEILSHLRITAELASGGEIILADRVFATSQFSAIGALKDATERPRKRRSLVKDESSP